MMIRHYSTAIAGFAFLLCMILITRRDFGQRNLNPFQGMSRSPAVSRQGQSSAFPNGQVSRPPVAGTIPRDTRPFPYADTPEDRRKAAEELVNPVNLTPENLLRGERLYQNFCAECHGPRGEGDGPVAARANLGMSLVGEATKQRKDGELFHIVTYGRLRMPPHAPLIDQDDRWRTILYMRKLQNP